MDIQQRIKEVLENTHLMSLGTLGENGVQVADVIFIFDDALNIYWMSDPDSRHSNAILNNNRVAATVTFSTKSKELNLGIQLSGIASKIEGERYDLALKHAKKRGNEVPKVEEAFLRGDSWYMLAPTQIDLIDEENFGFTKHSMRVNQ